MKAAAAVKSAERTLSVLELLGKHPEGLTLSRIAQELDIPASSTFHLLQTLEHREYIQRDPATRQYRVGVKLFELGSTYVAGLDLVRHGVSVVREIASVCGETVHLAVREGHDVIYIAKEDSIHAVRMVSAIGRRIPAHCTAVGKVLLAALEPDTFHELYNGYPLERLTENTIVDLPRLACELEVTRRNGYARDDRESNPDINCVAMPVYDHTGRVAAALSISVPSLRMPEVRYPELLDLLGGGASKLSLHLGHRPGLPPRSYPVARTST